MRTSSTSPSYGDQPELSLFPPIILKSGLVLFEDSPDNLPLL
ncbi:MAG: hypothetical protein ACOCZ5_02780 [bacterium]